MTQPESKRWRHQQVSFAKETHWWKFQLDIPFATLGREVVNFAYDFWSVISEISEWVIYAWVEGTVGIYFYFKTFWSSQVWERGAIFARGSENF